MKKTLVFAITLFLCQVAWGQDLICISGEKAIVHTGIKPDMVFKVADSKRLALARYNANTRAVFIPSDNMVVGLSNNHIRVVYLVYKIGECAIGVVIMSKLKYIQVTGGPNEIN